MILKGFQTILRIKITEYNSAVKSKNAGMWLELKSVMPSKASQKEKVRHRIISLAYGILKNHCSRIENVHSNRN